MSLDHNNPDKGDSKQVDKDQSAAPKKTILKWEPLIPVGSEIIPEKKRAFSSDDDGGVTLEPSKFSRNDPFVLILLGDAKAELTDETKKSVEFPFDAHDFTSVSQIENRRYAVFSKSQTSHDSTLALVDMATGKSFQKKFSTHYGGCVVLNKNVIGLFASVEGLVLLDVSFDAKKGPSFEVHKQQPTLTIKNHNDIFVGTDYWLSCDGKTLFFHEVIFKDDKFYLQRRDDILGDKGRNLFGDYNSNAQCKIIEGKYFLLYTTSNPDMYLVVPETGQIIQLDLQRKPGDQISISSDQNSYEITVLRKGRKDHYEIPNPYLFSDLGHSLREIGKISSGDLHQLGEMPTGVLDIMANLAQPQPDKYRPTMYTAKDKKSMPLVDELQVSVNFDTVLSTLIGHMKIRTVNRTSPMLKYMKEPGFIVSEILKKIPELDQLLLPRKKESLADKIAAIPAFFKKDKKEDIPPLSEENHKKVLLIFAALVKILNDCREKQPRTKKELNHIFEETLGTEIYRPNRVFLEKLLNAIEDTAKMLDESMIKNIGKGNRK